MADLTLLAGAGLAALFIIGLTIYITSSVNGAVSTLIKSNKNLTSKLYYISNTLNVILSKINFLKQDIETLKKDVDELKVMLNTTYINLEKNVNTLNNVVKGLTKDVNGIRSQMTLMLMMQFLTLIVALGAIGLILM